ncbi:5-methylcytosine-specific restriction enzyme subunit McrC [Haloechinothrix alba]|uniref:5-methylcytosine-specific restriction enzyme subunit McrC n=1 Tax=Haloechinothrix alba TaxID=664784 RepID=A0A238WK26_9PSEU|nr:restriction endonuclease [Haloechinothrix alba]SNR46915.1 5-methylcytosine-specific restriction enzyme subunit McrC [Haloechinothrix alba]
MTLVELEENGAPVELRCTEAEGRALAESGVVDAHPATYGTDLWVIRDNGKVGVACIDDIEVWVHPKIRIDRLLFLLGYLVTPRGWRPDTAGLSTVEDLVPALAQSLWRQAERALARGLLQGYREYEDTSHVLRGRLREADQLRKHHGLPMPLEVRYDEFTTDIPENQILRASIDRMLRVPRVDADSRKRLRGLRQRLSDVSPLIPGRPLPGWVPSRLNTRYQLVLAVAELVWRGTSVEHQQGSARVNGFMVNMAQVFEDFVTVGLSEEITARGGRPRSPATCSLDTAGRVTTQPDLVWYERAEPVAVVDAKYKVERVGGFHDNLYQMLAYCTALNLPRGHLVYAKGNTEQDRYVVRNAGIEILCHTLDLQEQPDELLAQISALTAEIAKHPLPM